MNKQEIVGLGIKIASLLLVYFIVRDGSAFIANINYSGTADGEWIAFAILVMVFTLVAAIIMYKFPLTVAGSLLPKSSGDNNKTSRISLDDAQLAAFTTLGIYILAFAIPDIFYWMTVSYGYAHNLTGKQELSHENLGNIVATSVELVMGLWLVLGAKGILGFLNRLRYAGTK